MARWVVRRTGGDPHLVDADNSVDAVRATLLRAGSLDLEVSSGERSGAEWTVAMLLPDDKLGPLFSLRERWT